MQKLSSLVLLGSSLLVGACMNRGGGADLDSAASAIDSSDSTEAEGNMMMASVDGADAAGLIAPTAAQVAVRVAANVVLRWNPNACATVAQKDAQVSITFKDCTGPRGLVHVSGELDLAISVSTAGVITVHGTSSGLQVNRADLMVDATATYAVSGTSHTLTVQTMGSGTGPRGNEVEHDGSYTLTWDTTSMCHTIAGHWQTDLGARERSNDVSLQRCAGGCPTGTVTHHFLAGASLTVTFDGTATAKWAASTGASGTTQLSCQ
ncbi:MAG TPA: hypothetical protein VF469_41745 [Kofleriaceae bacterium]